MFRREFFAGLTSFSLTSLLGIKPKEEEIVLDVRTAKKCNVIFADGSQQFYKNGQLHRDGDKPAVIWTDGTQKFYKNGQLHRDGDKPAVIGSNGSQQFYKNGQRQRDGDKPAII